MRTEVKNLILQSIDDGIDTYGPSVKNVVYSQFRKWHQLVREDIPSNADTFSQFLKEFFGNAAALHIESQIVKRIHKAFNLERDEMARSSPMNLKEVLREVRSKSQD
jgi:hypothetical protein